MRFVLLTTTDLKSGRSEQVARLIKAVAESRAEGLDVIHFILLQRCTREPGVLRDACPDWVRLFVVPDHMSASAARNLLLHHVRAQENLQDYQIVLAFPDDDAWYPPGILRYISSKLDAEPDLDVLVCRYSSSPATVSSLVSADCSVSDLRTFIRSAAASTIFVRGLVAAQAGNFDEELGLGTSIPGAEDLDFALRCRFLARKTATIPIALIGHPDRPSSRRARYYPGNLVVHWRYTFHNIWMPLLVLRMNAIGFLMIFTGELSPRQFWHATSVALFGRPEPRKTSSEPAISKPVQRR